MTTTANLETVQKEIELSLNQKLADFEERLLKVSTHSNPNAAQLSDDFYNFKSLATSMLSLLRQQVYECIKTVDQIDMRQRQKVLLFHGIDEKPDSGPEMDVLSIIQSNMGLSHITSTDIKRCHRLGVSTEERVQPILIQFHSHKLKTDVWKSKAKLKGTAISVAEFLTRSRQAVYKSARTTFGMRNVWTMDGVIYIKTADGGRSKIVTEYELKNLIAKTPTASPPAAASSPVAASSPPASKDSGNGKCTGTSNRNQDSRGKQPVATTSSDDSKRTRRVVSKK